MSDAQTRCNGTVHDGGRSVSFHGCRNTGIIREEGKLWCKTHAPSLVAKKRAVQSAKWDVEYAIKTLGWDIQAAKNEIAEAMIAYHHTGKAVFDGDVSKSIKKYLGLCEKQIALKKELGL